MRFRLFIPLVLILCAGCSQMPLRDGQARNGVLDLRDAAFDHPIRLSGEWLARAATDLDSRSGYPAPNGEWKPAEIPGLFTQQGMADEGMAWYRLEVRLAADAPPLSGYVRYARNASAVYAATGSAPPVLLGSAGHPSANVEANRQSRKPFVFALPRDTTVVLTWAVSNHDYQRGGAPTAIVVAPPEVLHRWLFRHDAETLLTAGVYLMLMLLFGGFWLWNRRDSAALTVSLLALVTMVRALSVEGYFELLLGDAVDFRVRIVLEAITFFVLPGLTFLTLWSLYPKEYLPLRIGRFVWSPPPLLDDAALGRPTVEEKPPLSRPWLRLNSLVLFTMAGVGGAFSLVALFSDTSVITRLLTAFRALTLSMCVLTPFVLFQIVERRRPMALVTLSAFTIVLATTVHDVLRSQGIINGGIYLAPYGLLTFLLIQSFIVARRSARNAHLVRHHAEILAAEVDRQTRDLKTAMVAAEAANAAKTQFLNAVSHEIRTPLTSIIGFTQILEEELDNSATKQDLEFVHLIRDSGDRLLRLVNDLLDLAKIETGKLDLDVRDVSLEAAISDVVRQSFPIARSKSLTLTTSPSIGDFTVRADAMRLHQILLNLVTNALKFTEEGGVSITAEDATLYGPDEEGRPAVAILVADTGSGMSQEFLPHVFDRFTQELRSSRDAQRGTGLGLALTRELTLRMNGRIDVESELGRGSVFTVTLPLAPVPASHAGRVRGDGGSGLVPHPEVGMTVPERAGSR